MPVGDGDGGHHTVPVQVLPWQVHVASSVGAGHIRDGLPNQDSVGRRPLTRPDGSTVLAIAVADGHGDARHFRSDRGSAMAVDAGLAAVEAWSAPGGGADAVRDSVRRTLVTDIVARWNTAVSADLAADPFTDAERAVLANLSLPDVMAYGSTLLIAAFTAEFAVFTQIGDGDIVAVRPDGQSLSPVPADDSLDGWQTTSLCQLDAADSFRTGVVLLADCPLLAALLATDGFGNAQADDPWPPGFAADLVELSRDHEPGWFAGQVPDWAAQCASADGSGDDTTMALIVRSAAGLESPGRLASTTVQVPVTVDQGPATADWSPEAAAAREALGHPGRMTAAPTTEFARPDDAYAASRTQEWPSPPAGHPRGDGVGQDELGGGGPGRGPGQRLRLRLWWLVAAIAVVLGGIGLVFALTGHSKSAPPARPRPTHQVTHKPQPVPSKPHKAHNPHKSRTHPRHKRHNRQTSTTAARPVTPGAALMPVLTTAQETDS